MSAPLLLLIFTDYRLAGEYDVTIIYQCPYLVLTTTEHRRIFIEHTYIDRRCMAETQTINQPALTKNFCSVPLRM